MKYRVFDKITGEDITDNKSWVIMPDGRLFYLDYESLTGDPNAIYILEEECYRYDICRKANILEALAACSEFCCDECPYQHLDHEHYKLRCIHTLIKDVYELLKAN